MIYITGDTHGDIYRFYESGFEGESKLTEEDYRIVCGDFGFCFQASPSGIVQDEKYLDELAEKPYTTLFIDGNHENFNRLNAYPVEIWKGGKVHKLRHNVIHLMRGQIFTIDGKRFFTMGGADSRDKAFRSRGYSWWPEELPSDAEYNEAIANLKACGMKVDYILTHDAPETIINIMGEKIEAYRKELNGFFDWVMREVTFTKWFFGHWHIDKEVYPRFRALSIQTVTV